MSTPNMFTIRALQITAAVNAFVSVGHTLKSQDFMNDAQFKRLPRLVAAYAKAGWFQGSSLFLIAGNYFGQRTYCGADGAEAILNLRWSRNPLLLADGLEKALAAVTTATYWATALWYMSQGDKATSGVVTMVGGLQVWSAFLVS